MKRKVKTAFFIIVLVFLHSANAQKKIKLINVYSGKVIELKEGTRVRCRVNGLYQNITRTGILGNVKDSTIQVDNEMINVRNIRTIGKRKQGTGFFIFALSAVAVVAVKNLLAPPNPCPQCQQVNETPESVYIIGGIGSAALLGTAIYIGVKNSPKDVTVDWRLEIVNQ